MASSNSFLNVLGIFRRYYADWHLAVIGTIRRVQRPTPCVKTNFALDGSP